MRTLAIIPAYNEEESIVATVDELIARAPGIDYVVVNDGSSDSTRAVCAEHGFNMIDLPVNLGLTAGFQTGMKYALRRGYDCAIQFDADGQHDPSYIAPMVENMVSTGADIVIGSRFLTEKKHLSARMTGSALIQFMVRLTTGRKLSDPTSGMRLYGKGMIERFARESDFGPEPDTVAYLIRQGAKVSEVQVSMRDRTAGESYLSFTKSISYMLRTCISILFVQWFR
ncbi:glycosyltransferase family 2 protein [Rubneribacter sp.]|nr:glycosyltransferase family 2 protein [Candidatus Rubneribacter avistercoris]